MPQRSTIGRKKLTAHPLLTTLAGAPLSFYLAGPVAIVEATGAEGRGPRLCAPAKATGSEWTVFWFFYCILCIFFFFFLGGGGHFRPVQHPACTHAHAFFFFSPSTHLFGFFFLVSGRAGAWLIHLPLPLGWCSGTAMPGLKFLLQVTTLLADFFFLSFWWREKHCWEIVCTVWVECATCLPLFPGWAWCWAGVVGCGWCHLGCATRSCLHTLPCHAGILPCCHLPCTHTPCRVFLLHAFFAAVLLVLPAFPVMDVPCCCAGRLFSAGKNTGRCAGPAPALAALGA